LRQEFITPYTPTQKRASLQTWERGAALFRRAGHDVATVPEQHLAGAGDRELIDVCRREGRCLVTLDLDFSNPLVFKPGECTGIAVLRLPPRSLDTDLWKACEVLVRGLRAVPITGRLWTVQGGRIREYRRPDIAE
jgi:predicted nuclease of predicted toxin-antitoxin system